MKFLGSKPHIYFDNAGAAPLDVRVEKEMIHCLKYGANPSAIYSDGASVNKLIDDARGKIATLLFAHSDEIVFTGSGTESDALAIIGTVRSYKGSGIPHIVTTTIEHAAVLENCRLVENRGEAEVTYVACDEYGIVNPKDIRDALRGNTVLVSVMYANNEIGTVQPIQEIAREIRHYRKNTIKSEEKSTLPFFHTDACQAMNYLPVENIEKLGVDLLSFNGSKIYGPKGIGVLYKKRGVELVPLYAGGGQEYGLRSGTENMSAITGVALALEITSKMKTKEVERLTVLRDDGIKQLLAVSETSGYDITLNGDTSNRLPNNINITISGISSELVVIELDAMGIMVSERSACASNEDGSSHVINALRHAKGTEVDETSGSVRITLGRQTTKKDIDYLVQSLSSILEKYKKWK